MSSNKPGASRLAVSVSLSPPLDRWLRERAQRLGLSHGAYIRLVLEQRREQEPAMTTKNTDDDQGSCGGPSVPDAATRSRFEALRDRPIDLELLRDHSVALAFVREIAAGVDCPYACGNCLVCRARVWLFAGRQPESVDVMMRDVDEQAGRERAAWEAGWNCVVENGPREGERDPMLDGPARGAR